MDPASITVGTIAALAFQEFVKAGVGETTKKAVGSSIELVKSLGAKIRDKLRGNERAEAALTSLETEGTETSLDKVSKYLELEMMEDQQFADDVQQIAQQIINIQNQSQTEIGRQYINQGRDQINIERVEKIERLGGS